MSYDPVSLDGIRDAPTTVIFTATSEGEIEDNAYDSLLYSRGYYLAAGAPSRLGKHWRSSRIAEYTLAWDSRNPVSITAAGIYQVAVIGRCFDLANNTGEAGQIGLRLLSTFRQGRKELGTALYDLAGRYVVILSGPDGLYLETDATGMKAAYYASGGGIVASHASLAASLAGTSRPSQFGDAGWFGSSGAFSYPGRRTEYADINSLTPNTRLSVRDGSIKRVHPLAPAEQLPAADAAQRILPLMQEQMAWLTAEEMPLVSLTAGLDSRVTLSACRPYREQCTFFSYVTSRGTSMESTRVDLLFASQLAASEGLKHIQFQAPADIPPELSKVMAKNSRRVHGRAVAFAYRGKLPTDAVHIRSNIYEIGRAFFNHGSRRELPALTSERMAQLLVGKGHQPSGEIVHAFDEWAEITSFGSVPEGYDAHDLFYWEIRMGSWMQSVLLESDIAHDTYTLINSRRILDLFLGASREERISGMVARQLIYSGWPELFNYPINGKMVAAPTG